MQNIFILNPSASCSDINDALIRKLEEAQSISSCLSHPELYNSSQLFTGALWAIDDLLEEIKLLYDVFCQNSKRI